ncbi:hypothetical protein PAPYR_9541 [Paratrimastix pyriformis]|uniref:Uncharacterized protein n=1 Tax=Paratrimastix pyriformis TaxID=342808 RepID=A0ABQ8UDQ8_9EUKA|nr:hypothetical protein PAPYR_9541 [Paratrimastix pyriformis]
MAGNPAHAGHGLSKPSTAIAGAEDSPNPHLVYIDPPTEVELWKCLACGTHLMEPVLLSCGHHVCRACVPANASEGGLCPVPGCGKRFEHFIRNPTYGKTIVPNLRVLCVHHAPQTAGPASGSRKEEDHAAAALGTVDGRPVYCAAVVTVATLQQHLDTECPAHPVACPDQCGRQVVRGQLPEHREHHCMRRRVLCPQCMERVLVTDLCERHMKRECARRPQDCRQGCGQQIPLADMDEHCHRDCKNRPQACPFHVLGCDELVAPPNLSCHCTERLTDHLEMLLLAVTRGQLDARRIEQLLREAGEAQLTARQLEQVTRLVEQARREAAEQIEQVKRAAAEAGESKRACAEQVTEDVRQLAEANSALQRQVATQGEQIAALTHQMEFKDFPQPAICPLRAEPLELSFVPPFTEPRDCPLSLTNPTPNLLAFRTKTTCYERYIIRPPCGLIRPQSTLVVHVLYSTPPDFPLPVANATVDKVLIEVLLAPAECTELRDEKQERDFLMEMFRESKSKTSVKLRARFVDSGLLRISTRQAANPLGGTQTFPTEQSPTVAKPTVTEAEWKSRTWLEDSARPPPMHEIGWRAKEFGCEILTHFD